MPFIAPIIEGGFALVAGLGSFFTVGSIATAVVGVGLSVAAGYLIQALTPKPSAAVDNTPGGVQFERQYGADVARQVACGLVGIAGHDTYVNTYGTSNDHMQQIFTLSDFYATSLSRVAINGEYVSLGSPGTFGVPVTSGDFANLIFIKFIDGRQSSADSQLVASANPSGRWTTNDIGIGVSAVIVTLIYDKDKNNSFPDFFFEFMGAPLYDWRKDTTVGGSGAHRWTDQTTWEFSDNPIVIEYNYRRGLSIAGDFFCGMGMPATDLPLDKYTTAANICDEIDTDGQKRYRCSIILNCMSQHSDNLKSIALSCGALQIDAVDGSWPLVGSEQTSVMTFTDQDIISTASNFRYTAKRSMSELVNSVAGNFPNPDQLWSMIGYDPQIGTSYIALDRRTRDVSIDFPQVWWPRQAAQLASIYLFENRYEAKATVTLRPRFQTLEVGDWIDWDSDRYGLTTYIVVGKQLLSLDADGPRNAVLTIQERNGIIYNGITPPAIVVPTPNGQPVYSTEVDSLTAIPVSVVGDTGKLQAAIRVAWGVITDTTVTQVDIMYYPASDPTTVMHKIVNSTISVVILTEGVVGATLYTVQTRIITQPERTTVFDAGVSLTTNDLGSIGLSDLNGEIQYQLTTLQQQIVQAQADFQDMLSTIVANDQARNWIDKRSTRNELFVQAGGASAAIEEVRTVAVDTQTAFAAYQITVNATFDDVNASVTTNTNAIATLDGYAAAEYSVTLDVNGFATGFNLFNGGPGFSTFTVVADKFEVALPSGSITPQPVFDIGTVNGVPTVGIHADMYLDGSITATSLNVINIAAINANLGAITAGTMTDPTGTKMLIDLNNSRIVISDNT